MWACNTALGAAGPPSKRVDPWEVNQKYCGQLLKASINIVCKGRSQKGNLIFSSIYYNETVKLYVVMVSINKMIKCYHQ